jgi:SHAQKYF class myb-like DNA-binding protein
LHGYAMQEENSDSVFFAGGHSYVGDARVGDGGGGSGRPVGGNGGIRSGDEAERVIGGGANQQGPSSHPSGPYPVARAGLAAPGNYIGGSDETSFNPGDERLDQGSLPYMMSYAGGSPYERRPENSYGAMGDDSNKGGGTSKNVHKRGDSESEDDDSAGGPENSGEEPNARTLKRPRLVWTPQLHKRFVDAVGHLGIKNAVPKTIMQLMNVEGLTRENVASHLQKYRLYLKRMQGLSSEGPSASDHLFASTPIPPNLSGPHYMPNHRDDVGPSPFASPNVPIPYTAIAPYPMGPGHYGGYEQYPYSAVGRGLQQQSPQGDHREHMMDNRNHQNHSHNYNHNHNQPSSPPQRILTLFPTSSH